MASADGPPDLPPAPRHTDGKPDNPRARTALVRWSGRLLVAIALLGGIVLAALGILDSPLGHRVLADRIAELAPANGLKVRIGRIDGSLYARTKLHDVVLSDPDGRFLGVPDASLEWRPLPALRLALGLGGGLDIRTLILRRGILWRAPHLRPGADNAPILPDYDVRIDHFALENLTIARGLTGQKRRVDLAARAVIRAGRAIVTINSRLGGRDRLSLRLDSEPDRDRFVLGLDYNAPRAGLLAGLSGWHHDVTAVIGGSGHFHDWHGWGAATADGDPLAGFALANASGRYRLRGALHSRHVLKGTLARIAGDRVLLHYDGGFDAGALAGKFAARGAGFNLAGTGEIDLAHNRARGMTVHLGLPALSLADGDIRLDNVTLDARPDGPFTDLSIPHRLTLARLDTDSLHFIGLATAGTAHWDGTRLGTGLAITLARADFGKPWIDQRLTGGRLVGRLTIAGSQIAGDRLALTARGLSAQGALRGDLGRGGYALVGRIDTHGLVLPRGAGAVGPVDGAARFEVRFGRKLPWELAANLAGQAVHPANAALAGLLGGPGHFTASLSVKKAQPWQIANFAVQSDSLTFAARGTIAHDWDGAAITGSGRQNQYGPFAFEFTNDTGPAKGHLALDSPVPALGIKSVELDLSPREPVDDVRPTYRIVLKAKSRLGPVTGTFTLDPGDGAPPRLDFTNVMIYQTRLKGGLRFADDGVQGDITLGGGGIDGLVELSAKNGGPGEKGQAVHGAIGVRDARFGGDHPISIGVAKLTMNGLFSDDNRTLDASLEAQGIGTGGVFIGRFHADATFINGTGSVTASLAGRRGTQLALQGSVAFTPDKVIAFLAGDYGGTAIAMPRRAVFSRDGNAWRLAPSQISFGSGMLIGSGRFGGGLTEFKLALSRMPLSALDIVLPDLGLGGYASGQAEYRNDHTGAPSGHAAMLVRGMTRSGLVLTSRPLDLALVATLDAKALEARAIAKEGAAVRGRLQAQITGLPRGGAINDRLRAGRLLAHLRYSGPADALWRLAAIDAFDLTGPIGIAANVTGTFDNPAITGAIASHDLRAQSAVTGSDLRAIDVVGSFGDSRLQIMRLAGTTTNGGHVVGSGTIDLSNLSTQGAALDLRMSATNAELINRPEMGATVTGPMRIMSDGEHGTLAGRLAIVRARWALGRVNAAQALPAIATAERNVPADVAPPRPRMAPWRLLVDAAGKDRIDVHGMGLVSNWGADIHLRGDTANPQIFGGAEVVRGSYEFAGKRFDLTRGRIHFNGEVPVDPLLDIIATGDANDVSATITIGGTAQKPTIAFTSTPALPEEELLSRILFGSSITQISAPEAVQLASALASLRSGGGLDPINRLRGAIGLDRLRVIDADATTGRGTSLAVGKYLGRRFYLELVTDGHGYSASSIEFRVTRWLALLATISTIDDESLNLKVTRDY